MKVFLQQIINVDGKNQIIEVNAWLKYIWYDYRLRWDPKKYDNITSIRFAGGENQIWRPDVLLYNSANEDFDSTFKSNEVVYNSGEFSSWTYHQFALDLHIAVEDENEEPAMDLSTFIQSGQWELIKAPAKREEKYSSCCPEPYATVTFYMYLRRRSIFYLCNIILPSMVIFMMSVMGFCLPPHDMSEKIGYQNTILLSICFFVTVVSELTPPTSESVPLLGMMFSVLTLISALSTCFTILVLNVRFRIAQNFPMLPLFEKVFLNWIPFIMLMRRPNVKFINFQAHVKDLFPVGESFIENCEGDCCPTPNEFYFQSIDSADSLPVMPVKPRPLLKKMYSIPAEHLSLERKVGEGILHKTSSSKKKINPVKHRRSLQFEKYVRRCIEEAEAKKTSAYCEYTLTVVDYYTHIHNKMKYIRSRLQHQRNVTTRQEQWKFAALALDRLCMCLFSFFIFSCLLGISLSTPRFLV
ncbi:hypothetical protein WR25_16913 [Diploscapter pachys]|uniref:Neurotransmitter-gated ion-channel ligand-binding domain-containing protein n=1 Tax=Diploscapter pachys TaxID=2018661 RepID=A0A2A2LKA8_9BILA|nr:hypothetical protein WR25_16913 [Diploscapter pachys]